MHLPYYLVNDVVIISLSKVSNPLRTEKKTEISIMPPLKSEVLPLATLVLIVVSKNVAQWMEVPVLFTCNLERC